MRERGPRITEPFGAGLQSMMGDQRLSPIDRAMYVAISLHCQGWESAQIGIEDLVYFSGSKETAARAAIKRLVGFGWVSVTPGSNKHATRYNPSLRNPIARLARRVAPNDVEGIVTRPDPIATRAHASPAESEAAPKEWKKKQYEKEDDLSSRGYARTYGSPPLPYEQKLTFSFREIADALPDEQINALPNPDTFRKIYNDIRAHLTPDRLHCLSADGEGGQYKRHPGIRRNPIRAGGWGVFDPWEE